jgi:hypothetical protein
MNSKKILLATMILSSLFCSPVMSKKVTIENLPNGTYAYTTQKQSKETRVIFRKRDKVVVGVRNGYSCFLGIVSGNTISKVSTVEYPQNIGNIKLVKLPNIVMGNNALRLNIQEELNIKSSFDSAGYPVEAGSNRTIGDRFNECLEDSSRLKKDSPNNIQIKKYEH